MKGLQAAEEHSEDASPELGREYSGRLLGRGDSSTGKGGGDCERKFRAQHGTSLSSTRAQGGQRLPPMDQDGEARPPKAALNCSSCVVRGDEEGKQRRESRCPIAGCQGLESSTFHCSIRN